MDARVLTVGDFWKDDTKDVVKKSVVDKSGVMYVDLAEIQDEPRCEAGLGTMAEGDDSQRPEILY